MATDDGFTSRLSEYLDDEELSPAEREEIAAHLEGCQGCRATLAELRQVVAHASSLVDVPPAEDLWPVVERRLDGPRQPRAVRGGFVRRRFTFTLPQLVAASLALMLMSGGAVWLARLGGPHTDFEPAMASQPDARPVSYADPQYDEAVADLERALETGRSRLDPETVRVLEENLTAIDRAIDQCRRALAADPFNTYLNSHLAEARHRKLSMLRRAAALVERES